jgi:hypothetical protein
MVQSQALLNMIINRRVSIKGKEFLVQLYVYQFPRKEQGKSHLSQFPTYQ